MASAVNALEADEAYIERVKAGFHGPKYEWFWERLSKSRHMRKPEEHGWLQIFDFDGDAAPKEVLRVGASGALHDKVFDALSSKVPLAITRVVILYYPWKNFLNMELIGTMGYALNLDPYFFITHFRESHYGRLKIHQRPPSRLHLDTSVLQFRFLEGRYVTACIVQNIVVIVYEFRSEDEYIMNNLSELLLTRSSCLQDDEAGSNLNLPPIDLVVLVLQAETLALVTAIDIEDDAIIEQRFLTETTLSVQMVVGHWESGHWESYWSDRVRLEATVRNLSAALTSDKWSKGHAPLAKRLLQEYNIILDQLRSQGEYIREGVQQINTQASIKETKRGVQQSDSVRRLTIVAFVFIPLNFATSFFGMNVQQLGTGSFNIGYFFLAAALIGAFAALLSCIFKPLECLLEYKQREIADDLDTDVEIIQKREILRQSRLGKKLWTRMAPVGLTEDAQYKMEEPGPKFRKAMKLSVNNCWEKLAARIRGSKAEQKADHELQIEGNARMD